jgi:hypothetical protein
MCFLVFKTLASGDRIVCSITHSVHAALEIGFRAGVLLQAKAKLDEPLDPFGAWL